MNTIQYLILDRIFTFSQSLSDAELTDTFENLRLKDSYISDELFVPKPKYPYSVEKASDITKEYQYLFVDDMGAIYLMNAKTQIMFAGGTNPESPYNLPYEMILAMERWIKKVWSEYDRYKLTYKENQVYTELNFTSAGQPPCPFKDIQWVLDPQYQSLEPSRPVNLNKQDYINYQ